MRRFGRLLVACLLCVPVTAWADTLTLKSGVEALTGFGPRVTGSPAGAQAAEYLAEQYRRLGYQVEFQEFSYPKVEDLGSTVTLSGQTLQAEVLDGSPAAKLSAPLVVIPGAGEPEDYAKLPVRGAIAVVRRGKLTFALKARHAATAGAVGLVVVNDRPGTLNGSLGSPGAIPVVAVTHDRGQKLLAGTQGGSATLFANVRRSEVRGRNVVAHLEGVERPTVLVGGHYDSVNGSPGANDNASGTAVVLELARRLAGSDDAKRVWFVAFDGEEDGLVGSRRFAAASPTVGTLKAMLNFDMVGRNEKLLVSGHKELVHLAAAAVPNLGRFPDRGNSDHASFSSRGVRTLFFHRGLDPGYHSPADTLADPKLLDATADAGLAVLQRLLGE
jgi:Zn-dependent M28 family amino/carboxypeptidase